MNDVRSRMDGMMDRKEHKWANGSKLTAVDTHLLKMRNEHDDATQRLGV